MAKERLLSSCVERKDHPEFGITSSGTSVQWYLTLLTSKAQLPPLLRLLSLEATEKLAVM